MVPGCTVSGYTQVTAPGCCLQEVERLLPMIKSKLGAVPPWYGTLAGLGHAYIAHTYQWDCVKRCTREGVVHCAHPYKQYQR